MFCILCWIHIYMWICIFIYSSIYSLKQFRNYCQMLVYPAFWICAYERLHGFASLQVCLHWLLSIFDRQSGLLGLGNPETVLQIRSHFGQSPCSHLVQQNLLQVKHYMRIILMLKQKVTSTKLLKSFAKKVKQLLLNAKTAKQPKVAFSLKLTVAMQLSLPWSARLTSLLTTSLSWLWQTASSTLLWRLNPKLVRKFSLLLSTV